MDDSDYQSEYTLRQIARAQKTLDEVQDRMRKFRNRKKEEPIRTTLTKAPLPDLNQYFTFIEEIQNNQAIQFTESQCLEKGDFQTSNKKRHHEHGELDKQNDSLTINQKLEKQKKSSICKLEEYYCERNEALDERIRELKMMKEKLVKDQKLLLRNNHQIQTQVDIKRQEEIANPKLEELQAEVRKMRSKINQLQEENVKVGGRKKQLERHIKEALKGHKLTLKRDMQSRPKSTSCQYH